MFGRNEFPLSARSGAAAPTRPIFACRKTWPGWNGRGVESIADERRHSWTRAEMVFQNPEGRLKEAGFTHITRALKSNHTSRSYCERAIFLPACLRIRIFIFRLNDLAHSYKRRVQRFLSKLILRNELSRRGGCALRKVFFDSVFMRAKDHRRSCCGTTMTVRRRIGIMFGSVVRQRIRSKNTHAANGAWGAHGLPAEIFTSGEGRWLALQIGSEPRSLQYSRRNCERLGCMRVLSIFSPYSLFVRSLCV
jgi:hypothetical protein